MNRIRLKTNQAHPQIKAYKHAIESGMRSHHVVPRDGAWIVKRAGAKRAAAVFEKKSDAVAAAKKIARNSNSELFVHGQDGRIQDRL